MQPEEQQKGQLRCGVKGKDVPWGDYKILHRVPERVTIPVAHQDILIHKPEAARVSIPPGRGGPGGVIDILISAFRDDPVMNWMSSHPDFLPTFFRITLPVFSPRPDLPRCQGAWRGRLAQAGPTNCVASDPGAICGVCCGFAVPPVLPALPGPGSVPAATTRVNPYYVPVRDGAVPKARGQVWKFGTDFPGAAPDATPKTYPPTWKTPKRELAFTRVTLLGTQEIQFASMSAVPWPDVAYAHRQGPEAAGLPHCGRPAPK